MTPSRHIAYQENGSPEILELSEEEFFAKMHVRYQPHLLCESTAIEKTIGRQCLKGLQNRYISAKAQWLGALFEPHIQEGKVAPVVIGWSQALQGYGLFAKAFLPKGTFIGTYTGLLRKRRWIYRGRNDYCFMYPSALWSWQTYTIDAEHCGNEMRYINHATKYANVEALGIFSLHKMHILIQATRDIPQGEELLLDYGKKYWRQRKKPYEAPPSRSTVQ